MRHSRWIAACVVTCSSLLAAACTTGGGGGSGPPANTPPVAAAVATPTTGAAPLVVNFSGATSTDADGAIIDWTWTFGEASATGSGVTTSYTYNTAGTYTVGLTVTDNGGATNSTTITVVVGAGNVSPIAAVAATPTSGHAPLHVVFDSTGTHDPDGSIASYAWNFGDSTAPDATANPSHTYTVVGPHVATLTVTDNQGATNSASVTITVGANDAPIASFTATPTTGKEPLTVVFDSALSHDPDGSIASYSWNFGDATALDTTAGPSHVYAVAGSYTAVLTVTDNGGATGTASVPITVTANQSPIADATATPSTGRAPLLVAFNSSASHDPDPTGSIVSYSWNFGDLTALDTSPNPSHSYAAGTFTAVLTVTDDNGATATKSIVISSTVNVHPTSVANSNTTSGTAPLAVNFDSSGSTDPDGSITTYAWNFGDSSTGTGSAVSHTYAAAGTYNAVLTVTDNESATTASSPVTIVVTDDATGRYVATTGTDSGTCASSASPCLTINYATGQATSGDTVHVAAGSYPEIVEVTKNLNYKGPNAGIAGSSTRGAEAVVKGFSSARAGSISDISSTTYSGSITNASNTSTITGVTGSGIITYASGAGTVTGASNTSPIVITTSVAHQLTTGNSITVSGVLGNTAANVTKAITVIDATHFSLDTTTGNGNYTSGGTYKGGQVIMTTSSNHGLTVGATYTGVTITSVLGNTAANGTGRTIVVTDANHFSVTGVTANAAYTGAGSYSNITAVIATAAPHGLANGAKVTIASVGGTTSLNGSNRTVTVIDSTHFSVALLANSPYTSGGTTTMTAIVVTTASPHNFPASNGLVTITGVGGNTAANATGKVVTVLDATHFSIPVTPSGDYTGGGTYTSTPMVVTTAAAHGLTGSPTFSIVGVNGTTAANASWTATVIDTTHLLLNSGVANAAYVSGGRYGSPLGTTVTGATNASPIVITAAGPHGLSTGQNITIAGVVGNTAANGSWTVTVVDATHYSLNGSTGNAAYTSGGTASGAQVSTDIDGFRIDAQGDAAYLATTATPLVSLFGGPAVNVHNNLFTGGTFAAGCSFTCTSMTDYAFQVASGTVALSNNAIQNFRRPVNIGQTSAITTSATLSANVITGVTARGISLGASTGFSMPGVTITGNTIDATGSTSGPAGITVSNGGNIISGNTFTGVGGSGVFIDLCKKFNTNNNSVTNNTFTGSGVGVYVTASQPGSQCTTSNTEGSGGWVSGGGRINGLVVTGNNFAMGTNGLVHSTAGFSPNAVPVSTGPVDSTCNWWGSATGPTNAANPTGTGATLSYTVSPDPAFTFSPWSIASTPGGACTGS